ncbi:MAG: hypothetical protein A3G32_05725 [Deltaproteobacteria bacterium RIFCSPLOWO2_12_FULL_40_28]|nr:MAG: hypothetical protein A3C45_03895 [Deltaproteobacteria bacterium RIFCSPHIGHO2_02_FULL_40_28]OGQ18965.1 MAG: hypothetical protein A3E27_09725 [Deltaproteobacteria bacterium RIFCSPHIGHO2_12_FULL_40_32]OGQ39508.1 MAG: hypothetical protein A3I69_09840 [Deltaproteobacteria bacterium RIFCSPLOWO2_02_FULL_40_36]OGQ53398.1 MAG: hypothetical protein A3G32_05725 [Deltaproteobacteria bacterium RIFCSPLOWO2_12_FULL_40_28]
MLDELTTALLSLLTLLFLAILPSDTVWADTSYARQDYEAYQKSPFHSTAWDESVREGFENFDREDLTSTIEFLKRATAAGCESPLVYFKLALSFEGLGSYYSASQHYQMAKQQFKKANKTHRYAISYEENYGRLLWSMGETNKALEVLDRSTRKNAAPWVLKLLGNYYINQGEHLKATSYLERLMRMNNNELSVEEYIDINLKLARLYLSQGQDEAAQRYYQRILEVDPNHAEARHFAPKKDKTKPMPNLPSTNLDKVMEIFENH